MTKAQKPASSIQKPLPQQKRGTIRRKTVSLFHLLWMHNSRDSTRRLSRAMPSGCTSLPESPAARCSVCRAKRIFRHASSSSGAASDPPRLLQEPAFLGRLSQKTNSKLFCQSKLRASHPAPGAITLPEQLWLMPPQLRSEHWQGTSYYFLCSKESDLLPGGKLEALENPPPAHS